MRKEFKLIDPYENELHVYLWETSVSIPKGVVMILHGASEYCHRYDQFAVHLNSLGFHVIGNDHLGHGKTTTDREKIYFASSIGFHLLYEGVKTVRDYVADNYPKLPVIMFAHSMGSFIGRYAILYDHKRYDKALFSGTGYFPPSKIWLGRLIAKLIIKLKGDQYVSDWFNHKFMDGHIRDMQRNGIINKRVEWLTQDRIKIMEFVEDEYCGAEFTIGAQLDILQFLPEIQDKKRIEKSASSTALYFMSGDLDGLGEYGDSIRALYRLYSDAGYSNVKYTVLANTRHEIINAEDRIAHFKTIGDWMVRDLD